MSDPRNVVVSSPFSCEREGGRYHLHGAWAGWQEVVEFAREILAADEAWKKAARCCRMATVICDHYLPDSRGDCRQCQHSEACHAATLAEIDSMPPPDEAALDAQRE